MFPRCRDRKPGRPKTRRAPRIKVKADEVADLSKTVDSSGEVTAFRGPLLALEESIYRFFPLFFLQDAVSRKRLVLPNPSQWDDPYEFLARDFWKGDYLGNIVGRYQIPFNRAFAMCWSSAE